MSSPRDSKIPTGSGWQARLTLQFSRTGQDRTRLTHCSHSGPLLVQRPFYPEPDGTCHSYILHPPGGVVGGDILTVEAELAATAQVLLTTPAAGKFYRSNGATARQVQTLRVAEGAVLEWLPQENIVYQGACVHTETRVELTGEAGFIGWEILCLGRPAAGEIFASGSCRQILEIWRDGVPLYLERGRYEGGSELLDAPWGLHGLPVTATLVCVTRPAGLVEAVRAVIEAGAENEWVGVSQLDGVLVCRYLGASAQQARRVFGRIWTVLRPAVLGKAVCVPRIWNT